MRNMRPKDVVLLVSLLFSLTWVASCGGGGGAAPPPTSSVAVSITPSSASPLLGNTQQFNATVTGTSNSAVTWSVNGVAGGNNTVGTVSNAGLYTAPQRLPSPATVTVKATSQADTSKSGSASVTVTSDIAVSIATSPAGVASTQCGASIQISAAVSSAGDPDKAVTWSVDGVVGGNGSVGTVSESGLYTAPSAVPTPDTVTVVATSVADPAKSASTTITILASLVAMAISPTSATAQTGDKVQFTVTVTGTDNPEVAWSVNDNLGGDPTTGTISVSGLYTVPAAVPDPRTVTVRATSVDHPSASAAATVLINPACQLSAAAMTDANGLATLCSGGFVFPVRVMDEDTGGTVATPLTVAAAVDPTRPGRALIFIADAAQQYPIQFAVLESSEQAQTSGLAGRGLVSAAEARLSVPARRGAQNALTAVRGPVRTAILGGLPATKSDLKGFADLFSSVTQAVAQAPVLRPPGFQGCSVSTSSPLDIHEYTYDLSNEWLNHYAAGKSLELFVEAFEILPSSVARLAAFEVVEVSNFLIGNATSFVYETMGASEVVKITAECGLIAFQFPIPHYEQPVDPSSLFPPQPNAHFTVQTPQGIAPPNTSIELISKNVLGMGIVAVLGTGGTGDIPVPLGNYDMRVGAPGFIPVTQDISVPEQGTTVSVTLPPVQ